MLDRLNDMMRKYEMVGDVRSMGLVAGVEIVRDKAARTPDAEATRKIIEATYQGGLMMIAPIGFHGNVIRIAPPLVITEEFLNKGLDIMEDAIKRMS